MLAGSGSPRIDGELFISRLGSFGMSAKTDILIRAAHIADLEEIVCITNAAYAIEQEFLEGPRTDAAQIGALFMDGEFLVAVSAEDVKRCIGSVYWKMTGTRGYFGLLAVHPSCQGKGIAKQMIQAVEQNCRQRGGTFLDITVISIRKELFPFYRHLGYASYDVEDYHSPQKQRIPFRLVRMTKLLCEESALSGCAQTSS